MRVTLYHLTTAGGTSWTTSSATEARRFLADPLGIGGRTACVVTYDDGKPVHVRTYPRERVGHPRQEGAPC